MGQLSIQSETRGSVMVVRVNGRIDSDSAPAFEDELTKAVGGSSKLVVDLKGVDYMSSAGIRAIVKASQTLQKSGGAIKMSSVPEAVQSLLYTVGLNQRIGSYATIDEAVTSF